MKTTLSKYIEGKDYIDDGYWNFGYTEMLHQFTDLLTGDSFTVDEDKGQTLDSEIEAIRKRFKEENK